MANGLASVSWDGDLYGQVAVIHCTHGLNRTGYMVCRALVEIHHLSLLDALAAFAKV